MVSHNILTYLLLHFPQKDIAIKKAKAKQHTLQHLKAVICNTLEARHRGPDALFYTKFIYFRNIALVFFLETALKVTDI